MENKVLYLLTYEELHSLLVDQATLYALENGGVDNWEWYGVSVQDYLNSFNENPKDLDEVADIAIKDYNEYGILGCDLAEGEG